MKKTLGKEGGRKDGWLVWAGHGTYGGEKGAPFCVGYAGGRGDLQPSSCIHRRQVPRILGGVRSKLRRFFFGTRMYLLYNSLHHIPHLRFRLSKCFVPPSRFIASSQQLARSGSQLPNPPTEDCTTLNTVLPITRKSTSRYNSSPSMTHPGIKSLIRPKRRSHGLDTLPSLALAIVRLNARCFSHARDNARGFT